MIFYIKINIQKYIPNFNIFLYKLFYIFDFILDEFVENSESYLLEFQGI
jgi:hypothetical protein